ncbi:hypothetical protein CBL_00281 [Carabus blaptoides fortunei]
MRRKKLSKTTEKSFDDVGGDGGIGGGGCMTYGSSSGAWTPPRPTSSASPYCTDGKVTAAAGDVVKERRAPTGKRGHGGGKKLPSVSLSFCPCRFQLAHSQVTKASSDAHPAPHQESTRCLRGCNEARWPAEPVLTHTHLTCLTRRP